MDGVPVANPVAEVTEKSTSNAPSTDVVKATVPPTNSKSEDKEEPTVFQRLTQYPRLLVYAQPTKVDILLLFTGTIAAILAGIPFPILGILFGNLIDDFNSATCNNSESSSSNAGYQSDVDRIILLIVYLAIAQFVCVYIHLVSWSLGGARLAQRLRDCYLRSLLTQEPAFFDKLSGGEVSSRLTSDIQTIQAGTSEKVGICIASASFFVTAYVVAFIKDAKLAGILVSLVPAYFLMSLVGGSYIEKYSGKVSDSVASAASIASEGLSNVLVVQAFSASNRLEDKFAGDLQVAKKEGMKKAVATGVQSGLMYFIAYAANALAFWQGSLTIANAVGADNENMTVGTIFTVIFILVDATLILSQVAPFLQVFGAAAAAFTKLRRDIEHVSTLDGTSSFGNGLGANTQGHIEFRNVGFTYPSRPEQPVLQQVTFDCPAGKHTAIVGQSGSGKSTIAGLVAKLYIPDEGSIFLDGQEVSQLNTREVRGCVSLVQQESLLLDRSILENIAHGLVNSAAHTHLNSILLSPQLSEIAAELRVGKTMEDMAQSHGPEIAEILELVRGAAKNADASAFIGRLQYGYGTDVGNSGRLLSGGQKQRIGLARALIKNPRILILDEATASLDSKSEQAILQAINSISAGRTMISIAHRLSTIKNADKIIVLREGRVLEQGNHSELMERQGAYAKLVNLQNFDKEAGASGEIFASASTNNSIEKNAEDIKATEATEDTEITTASEPDPKAELAIEENPQKSTNRSTITIIKALSPLMRPHTIIIGISLIAASIVGGAFSAEAVIFSNTVGNLNPCKSEQSIRNKGSFFALMFFVLAIIEFFANFVSWAGFGWVAEKILYKVRVLSFRSLFEQDLQWHQSEGRTVASLLSIITNDGNLLAGLSGSILGSIFSIIVNLIVAVVLTHVVAWKIAVVCLALVPILLGVGLMELKVLAEFEDKHANAYVKSVGIGVEAVNSIKAVAALSLEHEILGVYRRSLDIPRRETTAISFYANIWLACAYFAGNLGYALAYWWGSKQILSGMYTQTQFLIVVFSLLVSAQLWSQMFALAPEVSNAKAAINRILDLIQTNPDHLSRGAQINDEGVEDIEATAETKPRITDDIHRGVSVGFRNVNFSYPARPDVQVLHDINIDVKAGQFCAFVGPSGAGKSTIISLVERMYLPSLGAILIDGTDITQRTDITFRDDIAIVPQESVLFEGSIAFNIGLGARPNTKVSLAEIEEACRLANIHDTIAAMPQGYETVCGPNGGQLSGGQKQRLAIGRALVRKPKLLILDESTSALDAESEKLLQDGLDKAAKGITVLAIAHRLHTIRKADVIFMMELGRCVDKGTHDELFERCDAYRSNVLHQTSAA